jgi:hypothetical protein
MTFDLGVDGIDDAGQGCGFSRTGLARDENEAARRGCELMQRFRHLELFQSQAFRRNTPKHAADAVQVAEYVHTESGHVGDRVREVCGIVLVELLDGLLGHYAKELGSKLLGVESLIVERDQVAVDTHARRIAGDNVEVRTFAHLHAAQEFIDQRHRKLLLSRPRSKRAACPCRSAARWCL